jgi:hypothetical protein
MRRRDHLCAATLHGAPKRLWKVRAPFVAVRSCFVEEPNSPAVRGCVCADVLECAPQTVESDCSMLCSSH